MIDEQAKHSHLVSHEKALKYLQSQELFFDNLTYNVNMERLSIVCISVVIRLVVILWFAFISSLERVKFIHWVPVWSELMQVPPCSLDR